MIENAVENNLYSGLVAFLNEILKILVVAETAVKLIFTEEENDEIMDIQSSLRTYSQEWEAAFIAGEHDIDADWDAYLAGLNEIGIERYTEVAQTAYSRMN